MFSERSRVPWGAIVVAGAVVVFGCIIAVTLLARSFLLSGSVQVDDGEVGIQPEAPAGSVVVDIASSNTKENWINVLVEQFNNEGRTLSSGEVIFVRATHVTSGGSQRDILSGKIQPQVWSPGDQSWVAGANEIWQDRTGRPLVAEACPSTILAPSGFAMWRPMAEALGWPDTPISWDDLVDLSADPEGWASLGHPEWGQFKFGHAHPAYSNVGLQMMTALAYSTVGSVSGLSPDEVFSEAVVESFSRVELNTYHYGIQSRNLINLMVLRGPNYLHAVTTSEAETLKTNFERSTELRFPLVFIFPSEGTFWSEHPYCVLDTDWVTPEQKEAGKLFLDYLLEPAQQALAIDNYLRPVNPNIPLHSPLSLDDGTDPRVTTALVPALESPSAEAANAVKDVFFQTKKKATVVLALDTSGSMAGEKIINAVDSGINFIRRLDPEDEVFVLGFGGFDEEGVRVLEPGGRAGDIGESLSRTLSGLFAGGNTPLFDAVCESIDLVDELQREDEANNERRLYGIVLLSDGEDTSSQLRESQMFGCLPSGEAVTGVKIFTIAYGDDADEDLLLRIANRTNGKYFSGDPAGIERIYNAISAEQ
jgi:Ca-activated chloride channel family protein